MSPDGRYLSFTNYETGDLGLRDLIAGTTRFLTNTGGWEKSGDYTARSVISPDGKRIVYHWFLQKKNRNELRVVSLDGTESPRTVYPTDKGSADYILPWGWTPDGKRVVAVRELADHTNQMLMVSIDGRSPIVIKSLGWQYAPPAISPDGRFVAYALPTDPKTGARDIFVLATDGSQETAVVQGATDDFSPQWSPDGGSLLFFSNRTGTNSLWSIPVGDGKVKGAASVVKADTGNIKPLGIASNGAYYYISPGAGGPDIYTVELDAEMKAARKPVLLAERFVNHNRYPMPSPDGKRLAYYSNRPENKDMLVIRTLETGEERDFPLPLPSLGIYGEPDQIPQRLVASGLFETASLESMRSPKWTPVSHSFSQAAVPICCVPTASLLTIPVCAAESHLMLGSAAPCW